MFAPLCLSLGKKGYDTDNDTLLMGNSTSDHALITDNGDFIGYWQDAESDPYGFRYPIGVAIRNVSAHIANMKILSRQPAVR